MYAKLRLLLAQILAVVALSIVTQLWAETIYRLTYRGDVPPLPLGHILGAALLTLFAGRISLRAQVWLRRLLLFSVALGAALLLPALGRGAPVDVTFFSILVFVAAYITAEIATDNWSYSEARAFLSTLAIVFGVALPAAHVAGSVSGLSSLLGVMLASMLALGLTWDQHVDEVTNHAHVGGRTKLLLLTTALFLMATLLAGPGAFTLAPLLWHITYAAREILMVLLVPVGYLVYALVILGRIVVALLAGEQAGESEARMQEPFVKAMRDLGTTAPWLLQIMGAILLAAIAWLLIRRMARYAPAKSSAPLDEHESLLMQIPALRGKRSTSVKRQPKLPLVPRDIWQVFAYLEQYGKYRSRPRGRAETVAEYEEALRDLLPAMEVQTISRSVQDARYGGRELTAAEWQSALSAWRKLKDGIEK